MNNKTTSTNDTNKMTKTITIPKAHFELGLGKYFRFAYPNRVVQISRTVDNHYLVTADELTLDEIFCTVTERISLLRTIEQTEHYKLTATADEAIFGEIYGDLKGKISLLRTVQQIIINSNKTTPLN